MRASESSNVFERLGAAITLRDIQQPFAFSWDAGADRSERKLLEHYLADSDRESLLRPVLLTDTPGTEMGEHFEDFPVAVFFPERAIHDRLKIDGAVDHELSDNEYDSLDSGASPAVQDIPGNAFVTGDTSLITFLASGALSRNSLWVVMDRFEFSGIVTRRELLSLPARLCFLALALELEEIALQLCKLFPLDAIRALSKGRIESAVKTLGHKLRQAGPDDNYAALRHLRMTRTDLKNSYVATLVVDATSLIDKATILRKLRLTIDVDHKEIERVFKRAERLRNCCAHPTTNVTALPFNPEELADLIPTIAKMTQALRETFTREMQVRSRIERKSTNEPQ